MTLRALAYQPPTQQAQQAQRDLTRDRQVFMRSDAREVEAAELYARMRRWELAGGKTGPDADAQPERFPWWWDLVAKQNPVVVDRASHPEVLDVRDRSGPIKKVGELGELERKPITKADSLDGRLVRKSASVAGAGK